MAFLAAKSWTVAVRARCGRHCKHGTGRPSRSVPSQPL
ncbi:hypothetical protein BTZ20_5641 [Rhodococcus sp. MTM3W5.2]|nr:hypothetical protein BTZ20_5641 [Rhodococcus sp. MTM3W5.2]